MNRDRLKELRQAADNATCCTETTTVIMHELLDEIERLGAALEFIAAKHDELLRNPMATVLCGIASDALGGC